MRPTIGVAAVAMMVAVGLVSGGDPGWRRPDVFTRVKIRDASVPESICFAEPESAKTR